MNVRDPDRKEVSMKKIVIIGANDFQRPLIKKAGEMGYETHVFALERRRYRSRGCGFFL